MAVDWRSLFDELRVEWVDRGPNTSRGNINICCPFCGDDDQGNHLSIEEDGDGYYCYRNPRGHSGRDPVRLLVGLGLSRREAIDIHNSHILHRRSKPTERQRAERSTLELQWDRFEPASESSLISSYLRADRGFRDIEKLTKRYDLRYAKRGDWVKRVLFPLSNGSSFAGWTGRSIDNREPRYRMERAADEVVYLPRPARDIGVVVEGPMDALKIAAATEHLNVSTIGMLGLGLGDSRAHLIGRLFGRCKTVLFIVDNGVNIPLRHKLKRELKAYLPRTTMIFREEVPKSYKDPGEMPYDGVERWLKTILPGSVVG